MIFPIPRETEPAGERDTARDERGGVAKGRGEEGITRRGGDVGETIRVYRYFV